MLDGRQRIADQKREEVLQLNGKIVITLLDITRFLSRQSLGFQRNAKSEGIVYKIRFRIFSFLKNSYYPRNLYCSC
jgi:hypothetical protein